MAKQYLLQNLNAGYVGNSPCFWHKTNSGYTPWIDDAKVFTKEEADNIVRSTRGTHRWTLWDLEEIRQVQKLTVDIQDLDKLVAAKKENRESKELEGMPAVPVPAGAEDRTDAGGGESKIREDQAGTIPESDLRD